MIKIQVNLKTTAQSETVNSKFELSVKADESVKSVKEKIAASQLIAFPDQLLLFEGKSLSDEELIANYGVKDFSSLDFVLQASEESIVQQLSELLQARDLTCDELALLYCYKHGVSVNQALKTIGCEMKLQDFLKKQQEKFCVENNRVSLVREDTSLKPFSVSKELEKILKETGPTMDITTLCSKFIQKFNVSVSSIVGIRPADFLEQETDMFVLLPRGNVTLKSTYKPEQMQEQRAPQHPWQRSKSPAGGRRASPGPVRRQPSPNRWAGNDRWARSQSPPAMNRNQGWRAQSPPRTYAQMASRTVALQQDQTRSDQMYHDLHTKISSRSFNSRIAQTLNTIIEVVKEKSFLNIQSVAKGGSVGKGTAIIGCSDAEIVFFVQGLPSVKHPKWLPPLLKSVQTTLEQHLPQSQATDIHCTQTSVVLKAKNLITVDLRFSPVFNAYADTVQALGGCGPQLRKYFEPSFIKEAAQFISKQAGQVKVTIRLLKWWREQQAWSCALTRPGDYLLELVAIYSAQQTKPKDQVQAVANCMSLLARFDELRIVWTNFYTKSDVWAPLMLQKPLLMDPVNPFVNVADPQTFDPRELMQLASTTHFFW